MRQLLLIVIASAFLAGSASGLAQEATPAADNAPRAPVHVHAGTCDDVGSIAAALAGAGYGLPVTAASEMTPAAAAQVGPVGANAAMVSVTTLDAPLTQLADGGHVIDAHRSEAGDETATRIACGAVGGFRAGNDLVFGLSEANGSEYSGTAWLHDNEDGSTTVTVFLVSGLAQTGAESSDSGTAGVATPAIDDSRRIEQAGLVVLDRAFAASALRLLEDVPTVLHVYNADDQAYYFRIGDLVPTVELPPHQLTIIEFTTPSAETYGAMLLVDQDEAVGLDLMPVIVE